MIIHVIDGTYELFRHFFGVPSRQTNKGEEVAATRAVLDHLLNLISDGATHIGVATDTVVESFRNQLYDGYKTGDGMDPDILSQFPLLEQGIEAIGIKLCRMEEYEADDGMASIAAVANADPRVERVMLCTPDKDLAQCVVAGRVLQVDRRNKRVMDVADVVEKYGVEPASIPDWLALTGDTADGFPGLKGWGKKSASMLLAEYKHLENIPPAPGQWTVTVRSSQKLAETLEANMEDAKLFKNLATLRTEAPTISNVDELRWTGPSATLEEFADRIESASLVTKVEKLAASR